MLILILSSVILILVYLIFILGYDELSNLISRLSDCFRKFIVSNTGFFTILFLVIFFLEQALLILFVFYFFEASSKLQILISIFALIVVTTATLQKFIWEYKFQHRSKEVAIFSYNNKRLFSDVRLLIDENQKLRNELKKKR